MNNLPTLVDSHCHLNSIDLAPFDNDINQVLSQAHDNGVTHMLSVCVDLSDVDALKHLADNHAHISISVGVHPNSDMPQEVNAEQLVSLATHRACIAIGETGLDYYRTDNQEAQMLQQNRFREHIRAALISKKPLIVHTRQAQEDTLRILAEEQAADIGGVMHCFTESWDVARRALDMNFYISFSGIITFNNAKVVQEVAKQVPLDRILIETDSPYLAPVPFRGKQNHPAWVKHVAQALSELRNLDYAMIAKQTTDNFYRCFKCD